MTIPNRSLLHSACDAYRKVLVANKRLPELEDIILTDSWYSYLYARDIIKGRWVEAEDIIMTKEADSYCYAADVIKGKLPDKMNNMMILHAIKNSNDVWVKYYFEFIRFISGSVES